MSEKSCFWNVIFKTKLCNLIIYRMLITLRDILQFIHVSFPFLFHCKLKPEQQKTFLLFKDHSVRRVKD